MSDVEKKFVGRPTKEELIQKIAYYKSNHIAFIKDFGRIRVPGGIIKFNMFDYQEELARNLQDNDFNIILKARQLGISTIVGAYLGTHIIFHPQSDIIIIAINEDVAKELILKIKIFLEGLPKYVRPVITNPRNKESIELANGSRVKALTSTSKSGRSFTASFLVLDESAFIENVDSLWDSAYPTVSNGGRAILLSCVTKDTIVITNNGIKEVGDFVDNTKIGGYVIPEYSLLGKENLRTGILFHNNGLVKTKIIKTSYSELEGSYNHKLWGCVKGKYNWCRLNELSVGDYVSIEYGRSVWGNNDDVSDFNPIISNKHKNIFRPATITKDLAYFIGLFLAEGSTYKVVDKTGKFVGGSVTISCGDNVSDSLSKLGIPFYHNIEKDKIHYTISSKSLYEFLEYLGFDLSLKAPKKIIPTRLLEMSEENIQSMLRGIFDGDGYARSDRNQVGIGLASKKMIQQIRMILLNMGMFSTYGEVLSIATDNMNANVNSMQYRLSLNNNNSVIFFEKIGFNFERKQKIYTILKESIKDDELDSYDIVPYLEPYLKKMYIAYKKELKLNKLKLKDNNINNSIYQGYKTISRKRLLLFYEKTKHLLDKEDVEFLDKVVNSNLRWTKVTEILESENETFDFSLPNNDNDFWCHSVVYNGFLGHQTPNGEGNLFHDIWTSAENGDNEFKATKLYWWQMPGRDEKWKQRTLANLRYNMKKFRQEYECVAPDTLIYTKDGVREIKNVEVGDYVLTHNGRFRKVTKTMKRLPREGENIYEVLNNSVGKLIISEKHPILILNDKNNEEFLSYKQLIDKINFRIKIHINDDLRWVHRDRFSIEKIEYSEYLYNISVEEDESYIANNIVVHNCSFEASSQSVISLGKINAILKRNTVDGIKEIPNFVCKSGQIYENLNVYSLPIPEHKYFFSVDSAEGLGEERDASAIVGFDLMDDSVMLEFAHKELNEKQFSKVLMDIAETYNNAFIVIEQKSTGKMISNYLMEWNYKHIIWTDTRMSLYLDQYSKQGVPSAFQYDKSNNLIPGFKTNINNKVIAVSIMKNAVEEDELTKIYTKKMLEQQKTFISKPGQSAPKYGANGKNNDDLVMAFAIGMFIRKYIWNIIENNNVLNQQILDFFMRNTETIADSQVMTEASLFSPIYNMNKFRDRVNPYKNPLSDMYGDTRYLLERYKPKK